MTHAADRTSALRALVSARLDELRAMSTEVLRGLAKVEETRFDDQSLVTTFNESMDDGRHRIVVQARRDRLLGISTAIEVGGFVVDVDGSRYPVAEEELWDFK